MQIYENGYIGVGFSTGGITPSPFPYKATAPMIAAFWADASTESTNGTVYYRETQDSMYLDAVSNEIRDAYGGSFTATSVVIVTWDEVGYCCDGPAAQVRTHT